MAAQRPQLLVIDDPLQAASGDARSLAGAEAAEAERAAARDSAGTPSAPAPDQSAALPLAQEHVKAVFGRVPASLARRLEGAAFQLRATRPKLTQQDLLAALLWCYVDHEVPMKLEELAAVVDAYDAARGR